MICVTKLLKIQVVSNALNMRDDQILGDSIFE